MRENHRTATVTSIVTIDSNEREIEVNDNGTHDDNYNTGTNTSSSRGKCKLITTCSQKIYQIFDCIHVEKRGIERILPEDRTDSKIFNTAMIWVGANLIIPCFAVGTLGPALFKLDLYHSFATIIFFSLLGIIPVALMACSGPVSGLRTMIFSRYSWGYYGASIMSTINVITSLGWTAINSITGAQTLCVVFNDTFPVAIGIIIIGIVSMVVSFVGYKWIHTYERYSWIPSFIGYCILAGVGAKYFTHSEMIHLNTTASINNNHRLEISRILSFGAACFGAAVGWCTCAADYNTYLPENTSQLKIFFLTYIGSFLSTVPLELLGAAIYTGTYTNPNWKHAYEIDNVGGLLSASLSSLGYFGKFILILFALATISCNIPNIYSLSLSAQVIAPIFERIPRFLYTVLGTIVYILLAIVAANKFNDLLTSLLGISSYCSVLFIVIVIEEHVLFRCCSFKNYNFHIWNNRKILSIGSAAILSSLIGSIGIALGMSQTWFNGPISKAIAGDSGEPGADVGFEIGFIFTAIIYPLFRLIELYFDKHNQI